jgi:hypothetical protein
MDFITEKWFIESMIIIVGAIAFAAVLCKILSCFTQEK